MMAERYTPMPGEDLLALAGLARSNPASPQLMERLALQPMLGVNVHAQPEGMRQAYIDQQALEPLAFGSMGDPVSQLAFLGAPGLLRAGKGTLEALATPGPRLGGRFASERGNVGDLRQMTEQRTARWGSPEAQALPPAKAVAQQTGDFATFKDLYGQMAAQMPGVDAERLAVELGKPGVDVGLQRLFETSQRPASEMSTLVYLEASLGHPYRTIAEAITAGDAAPVAGTNQFTVTPQALIRHSLYGRGGAR